MPDYLPCLGIATAHGYYNGESVTAKFELPTETYIYHSKKSTLYFLHTLHWETLLQIYAKTEKINGVTSQMPTTGLA